MADTSTPSPGVEPALPPALQSGSKITVIAPSGPLRNPDVLPAGIARIEQAGFIVRAPYLPPPNPSFPDYLAASDLMRLSALNEALRDPDTSAIFCMRGGYGALRLLDDIDYEAAARHPKLLVGYSDITALQLALFTKAGMRGVSGPMVAVDWPELPAHVEQQFWSMLQNDETPTALGNPDGSSLRAMHPGTATGTLLGGNFYMLTRLIGTSYLPSLSGAILFLEDVNESAYRLDGMLAHLKLAGLLDQIGGMILGGFTETEDSSQTILNVFKAYTKPLGIPVAHGLAYGHFLEKTPLPIGVNARLTVDSQSASLHLLEPVVGPNLTQYDFTPPARHNPSHATGCIRLGRRQQLGSHL